MLEYALSHCPLHCLPPSELSRRQAREADARWFQKQVSGQGQGDYLL